MNSFDIYNGKGITIDYKASMGNSQQPERRRETLKGGILQDYEHHNGKKLLAAIKANRREGVKAAIETARMEFIAPTEKNSNKADYDVMVAGLIKYLTTSYDIGDGIIFKKTPIEYCLHIHSNEARAQIEELIEELRKKEGHMTKDKNMQVSSSNDRVATAKARLMAFRENK